MDGIYITLLGLDNAEEMQLTSSCDRLLPTGSISSPSRYSELRRQG